MWIEIDIKQQSNVIRGVVCGHPNGDVDKFMNYINTLIESIHQEEKLTLLMGDFNVDLIKTNSLSDNLINILGSLFFHPLILQTTRITGHSATLIDSIFINSIKHFVISGNLVYDLTDHLPNFII